MHLRFLGKDKASAGGDSPTLYATDQDSLIVQGWKVPGQEAQVTIPFNLFEHFDKAGLYGVTPHIGGPFTVGGDETCIVEGKPVTDVEVLAQMRIPAHESCVEITKATIAARLREEADDHA
ncbi:hypothetical protein ACIBKY_53215 [Nonomuraea sp. NPDC050394]|uniref:hypothetical protein n=1 Tax=Nonomuraea sp. NPDC050394 TaxID=3364363 RepID=UPI0037A9A063